MIGIATWIVWLHLLGVAAWLGGAAVQLAAILPAAGAGGEMAVAARRAHFVTSRGMEVVILTGILNVVLRGMASGMVFSTAFLAMLSLKVALVVVMAGLQIWMGVAWRREGGAADATVRRTRLGLTVQLALGVAVVLLGLGVRSV